MPHLNITEIKTFPNCYFFQHRSSCGPGWDRTRTFKVRGLWLTPALTNDRAKEADLVHDSVINKCAVFDWKIAPFDLEEFAFHFILSENAAWKYDNRFLNVKACCHVYLRLISSYFQNVGWSAWRLLVCISCACARSRVGGLQTRSGRFDWGSWQMWWRLRRFYYYVFD
jgi:hypothetical protein